MNYACEIVGWGIFFNCNECFVVNLLQMGISSFLGRALRPTPQYLIVYKGINLKI